MLIALRDTILETYPKYRLNEELKNFLKLIDSYLIRDKEQKLTKNKIESLNKVKIKTIKNRLNFKYTPDKKCANDITFAKNIWDMKLYENKIYIGTGNSRNKPPSCNAGPVPIITLNIKNDTLNIENQTSSYIVSKNKINIINKNQNYVKEEKINNFLVLNNQLMFSGQDSTQSWSFGNIYKKKY